MPADPAVLWEPETLGRTGAGAIVAALIAAAVLMAMLLAVAPAMKIGGFALV